VSPTRQTSSTTSPAPRRSTRTRLRPTQVRMSARRLARTARCVSSRRRRRAEARSSPLVVFAAHSTTNMGSPVDGDWPQFLGDRLATTYGGVGIGMEGANGGTNPVDLRAPSPVQVSLATTSTTGSRPSCSTTPRTSAMRSHTPSRSPAQCTRARATSARAVMGPFVNALFIAGNNAGTPLMRSHESPWMAAQTVRTVCGRRPHRQSALRRDTG